MKYRYFLVMDWRGTGAATQVLRIHKKETGILRGVDQDGRYYEQNAGSKYENILNIAKKHKGTDFIEISQERANEYCKGWYNRSKEKTECGLQIV